jgi:dTDP-glucose pyrophosphorylase
MNPAEITFSFLADDVKKYHLNDVALLLAPNVRVETVQNETQGALCTALLSMERINNDNELLIITTNDFLDMDYRDIINSFRKNNDDAGIVVFESMHPRYAYAKTNSMGYVTEIAEKRPISSNALASFYWFKKCSDFVNAAMDMIKKDDHENGLFYIAPSFNELILQHKKIGAYLIPKEKYHPLKTNDQVEFYTHHLDKRKSA